MDLIFLGKKNRLKAKRLYSSYPMHQSLNIKNRHHLEKQRASISKLKTMFLDTAEKAIFESSSKMDFISLVT